MVPGVGKHLSQRIDIFSFVLHGGASRIIGVLWVLEEREMLA